MSIPLPPTHGGTAMIVIGGLAVAAGDWSIKGEKPAPLVPKPEPPAPPRLNCRRNAPCPCGSGKKFKRCHRR